MMFLLLGACSDQGLHTHLPDVADAAPRISVTPERLDFWSVGAGESTVETLTVWSTGDVQLAVSSVTVEGDSFALVDAETAFDLPEGESKALNVAFSPLLPGTQEGEVVILSDDPLTPELRVPLSGDGRVPSLAITPDPWDFGALKPGCSDTVALTLQNVGSADLDVTVWAEAGDAYTLTADLEPPFTLAPYAYTTATVTFAPTAEGEADATFSVTSNDPRGVVTATQTGEGSAGNPVVDTFPVDSDPPVDILFAVDQSVSMDDDAAGLGTAFGSFIDTISAATSGWHLGVVTLDDGCLNGGVLDASTPDFATAFADAVAYGEDLDITYDEALFQLVDTALDETSSGCNAGFLRDGALLHVVVVSDEPERSTEVASAWTWDWYLDRWVDYVASDDLLRVSGVVDTDGCGEGDAGYAAAIAATGGEALSICTGDWADRALALATASLEYAWSFPLSEVPADGTVVVTVDGVETDAWTWDEDANAVVLEDGQPGSTIEVSYLVAEGC